VSSLEPSPSFRWMTPVLVLLAIVGALALPALNRGTRAPDANGPPSRRGEPSAPHVFRFYQENPTTIDPGLASDAYASTVIAQVYSPLVGLTSNLEPTPQVADSWTISRNGLEYVFHIRNGVRFHDGLEVTAEDFEYSLTRLFTEPFLSQGLAAGYLDAIDGVSDFVRHRAKTIRGIRVLDHHRLQITLTRPYHSLLSALALDQTSAVPRERIEQHGNAILEVAPDGCGPFRFVRREGTNTLVLARNRDYFMGVPAIDTLIFYAPTGDVVTRGAEALLDGRATLSAIPAERVEEFRARPGINILRWQDLTLAFIGLNTAMPPFDDARVRQAIAMAADREGMIRAQPEGKTLAVGILPPGLPGYSPVRKTYARDPAGARALLAAAGYGPGHPVPKITLWKSIGNAKTRAIDSVFVESLADVGIRVEPRYVSWASMDSLITGRKAAMFSLSWVADIPDPDTFLRALFYSTSSTNYFRYASATVDSLLDLARNVDDPAFRMRAYGRAEAIIVHDAPFIPLHHPASFIGLQDNVVGLQMNPLGISTLAMEKLRFEEPRKHDDRNATR
jgi:oligopeptide transport system substrate-binding protein